MGSQQRHETPDFMEEGSRIFAAILEWPQGSEHWTVVPLLKGQEWSESPYGAQNLVPVDCCQYYVESISIASGQWIGANFP